jgi:hypothetical protein
MMNNVDFQKWTAELRNEPYCNDGWTVITLVHYFENKGSREATYIFHKKIIPWCQDNLQLDTWAPGGVTRHSYRIQFKHSEDAVWFKLVWLSK